MMPKQHDIEVPLLRCIDELGGRARPSDVYAAISKYFPDLTEADLTEPLSTGGNKWKNRVQWVRQALIGKGELHSPERGVWAMTDKGRNRLREKEESTPLVSGNPEREGIEAPTWTGNLEEITDSYFEVFKEKVIQRLLDLTPKQFEEFAGKLIAPYGFSDVKVTGHSGDGGIDGYGKLRVGLAGAVPVVLLNGDSIVQLMVEKGLGIRRRPVEIYEDNLETLFEEQL